MQISRCLRSQLLLDILIQERAFVPNKRLTKFYLCVCSPCVLDMFHGLSNHFLSVTLAGASKEIKEKASGEAFIRSKTNCHRLGITNIPHSETDGVMHACITLIGLGRLANSC